MATRHYGTGSVWEDKARGRWVGQVLVEGRRRRVYGPTKAEAWAEVRRLLGARDDGRPVAPAGSTAQWLRAWLDDVVDVAPATEAHYRQVVDLWVAPYLGQVPLAKLAPEHVLKMMHDLEAKGLKASSVAKARKTLCQALGDAERFGKVPRNVAKLVKPPKGAARPKLDDTLTAAEVSAVLGAAKGNRYEALAVLVLGVGLRLSEALDLRWEDVDLDGRRAIVHGTKTEASDRVVALPATVAKALKAHRAAQLTERMAAPVWAEPGLVFATAGGTRVDGRNAREWWYRLCDRAGVVRRRFHATRHTAATLMLNEGRVPLEVVSKTLGHASLAITADIYAKVGDDLKREAADAMDRVLGRA